jgi:integrase
MVPLAAEEVGKFWRSFRTFRELALVGLMLLDGLRSCEVLALQLESLKGRQRGRAMTPAGLRSLFRHPRVCSQVPHANAHRFRPSFGADLARAGISLPARQHRRGHSQIHTTRLYVQLAPQEVGREYARAVDKRTRLSVPPIP